MEAERNASLLTEYHSLYELQRKRLEATIDALVDERDVWIKTAYAIAMKMCDENKLNVCKRLNMTEKSWLKKAKRFSLMIADHDIKDIMTTQTLVHEWKTAVDESRADIDRKEKALIATLQSIGDAIVELKRMFLNMTQL